MPRRSDASERPGLKWMVRSRISSKLAKTSGPDMKAMMGSAFWLSTPGVTSTSTRRRTSSGLWAARAMAVRPPNDMPTTISAPGASASTTRATSAALEAGE